MQSLLTPEQMGLPNSGQPPEQLTPEQLRFMRELEGSGAVPLSNYSEPKGVNINVTTTNTFSPHSEANPTFTNSPEFNPNINPVMQQGPGPNVNVAGDDNEVSATNTTTTPPETAPTGSAGTTEDNPDTNPDTPGDDTEDTPPGADEGTTETASDGNPPPDDEPPTPEQLRDLISIPDLNFYAYAEAYAKLKNLFGTDRAEEMLNVESAHARDNIANNVYARVNNELAANPNMSLDEIRGLATAYYLEAVNQLQGEVISAIDGQNVYDSHGNLLRKGKLMRRFGAFMDKHGKTIKTCLLVGGLVGAAAVTAGLATGVIVPAFAVGTGTAIGAGMGAAKGAGIGAIMSRHGSEKSSIRGLESVMDESEMQRLLAQITNADEINSFTSIANFIMQSGDGAGGANQRARQDHRFNVSKTRKSMAIGGALGALAGGLFGSMQLGTEQTVTSTTGSQTILHPEVAGSPTTEVIPNQPPPIISHQIQPGELTGQVLNNMLHDLGIDDYNFVNPDGSTNMQLLSQFKPDWDGSIVHSYAGADSMSDPQIAEVMNRVIASHDWGSQTIETPGTSTPAWTETIPGVTISVIEFTKHIPATIVSRISGLFLVAGLSRLAAERARGRYDPSRNQRANPAPDQPPPTPDTPPGTPGANNNPAPETQAPPHAPGPAPAPGPGPEAPTTPAPGASAPTQPENNQEVVPNTPELYEQLINEELMNLPDRNRTSWIRELIELGNRRENQPAVFVFDGPRGRPIALTDAGRELFARYIGTTNSPTINGFHDFIRSQAPQQNP